MARLDKLLSWMRELEEQLERCNRCGSCQAVCPLFRQTGREADVARGKLALLEGLLEQLVEDPQAVRRRLDRCLLCGSCADRCPAGVDALDIFIKARGILSEYLGLSAIEKAILRGVVASPRRFDRWAQRAAGLQTMFSRPADGFIGTSCPRFISPLIGQRHFKPLARKPFHRQLSGLNRPGGTSDLKVAMFVGCLVDKFYPSVAWDLVRILRYLDIGVFLPQGQGCCGMPALSAGDQASFLKLLHHHLALFQNEQWDYIVTPCATCTAAIHHMWPLMAAKENSRIIDDVRRFSGKTMDITRFLATVAPRVSPSVSVATPNQTVTYHDPCHLKKTLGISGEPRELIRANPRVDFIEMPEADTCCGMGGSFNLSQYRISSAIGDLKRSRIASTNASVVASACPACLLQISDALSRAGDRIAVKHVVEIYAAGIDDLPSLEQCVQTG